MKTYIQLPLLYTILTTVYILHPHKVNFVHKYAKIVVF